MRRSVVVVGFDQDVVVQHVVLRRVYDAVVPELLDDRSELGTLRDDGLHPLRLLEAPGVHIPDGGGALGEQRHDSQSHCRVGYLAAVHVYALQSRGGVPRYGDGLRGPGDGRSHLLHYICECNVPLDGFGTATPHRHRASGDRGTGEEVGCRGGVAFYEDGSRAHVLFVVRDEEGRRAPPHLSFHRHFETKFFHQSDREGNVWGGDEFVFNTYFDVSLG